MDNLGINVQSMLIYFVLFGLLFMILEKSFLPSIRKVLAERRDMVLKNSEERQKISEMEVKMKSELEESKKLSLKEGDEKISELLKNAEVEAAEIVNAAKKKAKLMLEEASELVEKYKRDSSKK